MPTHARASATGRANARRQVDAILADADIARRAAGLSYLDLGRGSGLSSSQVGRLLRGEIRHPTADELGRLCAGVGLRLVMRAYPASDPIRDAAHTALLERFRAVLHPGLRWATEVPLPIDGDLRAWDAMIKAGGARVGVEAETSLVDIQAMQRRIALKQRDGGLDLVVLLIANTRANHRAFESAGTSLRSQFPMRPRAVLAELRAGRLPAANGYVFA